MAKKKPSVLYFHPLMEPLAEGVVKECTSQNDTIIKGSISWDHFPDHWPKLFIKDVKRDCAGRDVIFLGSLHAPEILFDQISVLYSLPRYLSRSVTFILPYFPTATMERVDTEGKIATASTMARILSATPLSSRGPCQIIIFDIHALQERFYFGENVIPRLESAVPLLLREIEKEKLCNITIAFPDDGAFKRFHSIFEHKFPMITCIKLREGNQRIVKIKQGNAEQHHCIIVDDLVMTGGTLMECAKALMEHGASKVSAFVTHAVFPDESWKQFVEKRALFDKFYITDSIPNAVNIAKHEPFKLLSIAELLSEILLDFDLVDQ